MREAPEFRRLARKKGLKRIACPMSQLQNQTNWA